MLRFSVEWWRSMGIWGWPNLLLVGIAFGLSIIYEAIPPGWTDHGSRTLGEIRVNFRTNGKIEPGEQFEIMLNASEDAALKFGFDNSEPQDIHAVNLPANENLEMTVIAPAQTSKPLFAVLTDARGASASWNLGRLYD